MELLTWLTISACGIAGAIIAHFLSHDLYAAGPSFAARLLRHAARSLPSYCRARYEEEWLAHLHDCNGVLSKLVHAFQCFLSAQRLGNVQNLRHVHFQLNDREFELDVPTAAVILLQLCLAADKVAEKRGQLPQRKILHEALIAVVDYSCVEPKQLNLEEADETRIDELWQTFGDASRARHGLTLSVSFPDSDE